MINTLKVIHSIILSLMRKVREKATMSAEFTRAARLCFEDFCRYNTLHGVRYFTVPVRHWTERLWWAIAVALALCLSIWMIYPFWVEWQTYPMTMTTTNDMDAVSNIPFPTVTICPPTKIIRNKFDLSSKLDSKNQLLPNVSHADKMRLYKLLRICLSLIPYMPYKNDFADEDIFNVIEDVAPNVGHVTLSCTWKGAIINCSEYLEPILTHHGVCFTFNGLNSRDIYTDAMAPGAMISKSNPNVNHWSMEEGYEHEFRQDEYPIRVTDPNQIATLEINLVIDKRNDDRLCAGLFPGFVLYFNSPYEPNTLIAVDHFQAMLSKDTHIHVAPKLTTTANGLRKYIPERRGCFYQSERQLRFYKTYSSVNCIMECWANLTKKICGCVDISMPRDRETKICGAKKVVCFVEVRAKIDNHVMRECNCLKACTSLEYPIEIEQNRLNIIDGKQLNESVVSQQQARLRISLQNAKLKTMQRIERVTVIDFLAMCGGVLGLFMGFSVMTIVEYIYYPFLRLYCTIQRLRTEDEEDKPKDGDTGIRAHSRKWTNRLKNYLLEYCDNSSIHGMRYFSLPDLHWIQRCYWAICCVASLSLCAWMTYNVWAQWQANPVLIQPLKGNVSRTMAPLPTITICPEVKTLKQKLDLTSALNHLSNLSHTETRRLNALANVCPLLPNLVPFKDRFANESIYDSIQDLAPQFKDTLTECSFDSRIFKSCFPKMNPILTDEGLCFAFNALNSHEVYTNEMAPGMLMVTDNPNISHWGLENGYGSGFYKDEYPNRLTVGSSQSLIFLSIDKRNFDYRCNHFDGAFKVILTSPGEVLKLSHSYFRIHLGKRNLISYKIKMIKSSEGLRSYSPNQRQCFYQSERRLRFFRMYTETNCEEECLANFTSVECGCVHFSMPRDQKTRVCGGASVSCLKAAKRKFLTEESGSAFRSKCNCLPACVSMKYKAEIQRTNLQSTLKTHTGIAYVHVRFEDIEILERVERFTIIDFLANCGGLLGECMGISVLSLIEIIFFVTLRLYWVIRSWIFQNTAVHPLNQESVEAAPENTAVRPTNQESVELVTIEHLDE